MYKDILYNILLHADSKTIINLCLVNKEAQLLLTDQWLWIRKFDKYNIPKINLSYQGFIHYEKCQQITIDVIHLIRLENEHWYIRLDVKQSYFYLPKYTKDRLDRYCMITNKNINDLGMVNYNVSEIEDVYLLLSILIYISKDNDMIDTNGITYLPNIINQSFTGRKVDRRRQYWKNKDQI